MIQSLGDSSSLHPETETHAWLAISVYPCIPLSLLSEVVEPLSPRNVRNAAVTGKRVGQGLRRIGVLNIGSGHGRVDQRDNAAKLRGGRKGGVAANGGDVLGEGVEVLLGSHEGRGASDDLGVVAERGNNLVGELELRRFVNDQVQSKPQRSSRTLAQALAPASSTPGV
jgi:hypothetical protein